VLRFVEGLSDRQAADAVRGRIDWKYALGLSLIDPGFDHTVLSEFRSRLIEGGAERLLLDTLLQRLRDQGLVKANGRQRTDSTHVLAAVRGLNRLERVGETVRAALNELAVVAPDWLQALAPPVWYERYRCRVENYRLPKGEKESIERAATIGADGDQLLAAIDAAVEQPWLAQLPAIHVLREVWTAQYIKEDGQLRWRTIQERPALGVRMQLDRKHSRAPIHAVTMAWWRKSPKEMAEAIRERNRSKLGRMARLKGAVEIASPRLGALA
jgi:transposase